MLEIVHSFSWWMWCLVGVALILLGVLVFLIWRRLGGKLEMPKLPALPLLKPEPSMPASRLSGVWAQFKSGIPRALRRSVLNYPLFIVVGELGSGKSTVIEACTDSEGQTYRFHPSYTDDALLQIYPGAQALVLEFSSGLLYDTTPAAYRALAKLWRRFPQAPQVVGVIDAGILIDPQADRLHRLGQALIGKIEAFAELSAKSIPLTLALTHMDKVDGYAEFSSFLRQTGTPLWLVFDQEEKELRLAECLDVYQNLLSQTLTVCSAHDHLKIVAFLEGMQAPLKTLTEFLQAGGYRPGESRCHIVRICFLSEHDNYRRDSDPFLALSPHEEPAVQPWNRHAKAALAFLIFGVVYLLGSYQYEKGLMQSNIHDLNRVATTPIERYATDISPLFLNAGIYRGEVSLRRFLPNYFPGILKQNQLYLIRAIRKYYLIPKLKALQFEGDAKLKTNNMLALLYAKKDNDIGILVLQMLSLHPEIWRDHVIGLPKELVLDYIKYNINTEELNAVLAPVLDSYTSGQAELPDDDPMAWVIFFNELQQILGKPFIDEAMLQSLQQHARELLAVVDRQAPYFWQPQIVKWLAANTDFDKFFQNNYSNNISPVYQNGTRKILELILSSNVAYGDKVLSYSSCLERMQALGKIDKPQDNIVVTLGKEIFSFNSGLWADLITRSRISLLLHNFIGTHSHFDGWVFFDDTSFFPDIEMNASNEGKSLFAGKGRIDGRLTRDAFEQKVKPAMTSSVEILAKLPISQGDKDGFADFMQKNLLVYAEHYVNAYRSYFQHFQIRIDSAWDLFYVLQQLQQPDSPLLQTLIVLKDNTALDLPATPQFQNFRERLSVFRFLQRLMTEQNGVYTEFAKFQLIMLQLQTELESQEPYVGKKGEEGSALKAALTPLGRVAMSMILNEEGSYPRLVKGWLQNAGINDFWQQPFLAPTQKTLSLGRIEISRAVDGIWSDIWQSNIQPLSVKFPFNRAAGQDAESSVEDITKALHPREGRFWITCREYLGSLFRFDGKVWVVRQEYAGVIDPSNKIAARMNAAQRFSSALWDEQGNQKPLQIVVRPASLPVFNRIKSPDAPLVSLAYLRSGGSSVFGFNQKSDWQRLSLEWWSAQPGTIGLEFLQTDQTTKTYTDLTISDSTWNFYRLLLMGKSDNGQYRWLLNYPKIDQKLDITFILQSDPWMIFSQLNGN